MNEIGKKITQKLIEIYGSADFVIGFLPYKRSMWNSMASVYEECLNAGAVAYILPLPYYLMPDKTEVCERDLFTNALPIDLLGKITFDFLVIHYPYDGKNKVTKMLPAYYTAELRNYGDKIIYIPYSCTNIPQLRVQPGIANVDYAFLGSEWQATAFINEWQKYGVDFTGRAFGYGSPKMDAIQKLKHKDSDIKTALVTTSLAPFLYEPFVRFEKYKTVMQDALNSGYNVIFRPHPLFRQTIRSMRPDTEIAYEGLFLWMQKRNIRIDESEDLEEALSQADILISDPSSVLEMWQSTGREYRII